MQRPHIWPLLLAAAIFCASGTRNLAAPDLGLAFSYDKLAHLLVFGLLSTAVLRIPRCLQLGWKGALLATLLVSGYGGLDEFRQSFTAGRSVELGDWIADTLGALLASVVYLQWHGYRRLLEWPTTKPARAQPPA